MSASVGSWVIIRRLKQRARVVGLGADGRVRVLLGSITLNIRADELDPAAPPQEHPSSLPPLIKNPSTRAVIRNAERSREQLHSIDLHGLTVEEALRRAEAHLDQAILAGLGEVRVVHGLGTGKIQRALHQWLASARHIQGFKVEEGNPGVTRVLL